MTRQQFYLSTYDWMVTVYYDVRDLLHEQIVSELGKMELSCWSYSSAVLMLGESIKDTGFTISDYTNRKTMIVLFEAKSRKSFANTFDHEKGHLVDHIATYYNLDPHGEEIQYLAGDIAEKMYEAADQYLCDC